MSIDDVVNVTITAATDNPTVQSFGTPLLMAYHNVIPDTLKQYSSLADMVSDGFHTYDPAYLMAEVVTSQNPRPPHWYIGKRLSAYTQTLDIGPLKTTTGYVYQFVIVDHLGVAYPISYTVTVGETIAQICTAIAALINALNSAAGIPGVTTTATSTKVHFVSTAGLLMDLQQLPPPSILTIADTTADPGIVADVQAVETVDSINWYGVMIDSQSKAEIDALAAHIESQTKIFVANNSDTAITDNASTTDVAYLLKANAYARTMLLYSASRLLSYSAPAWVGGMLPTNPGAGNWAFRTLAGVPVDSSLGGLSSNVQGKNANTYTVIAGLNCTFEGKSASGEYIDITVFCDWMKVTIQARIFQALKNASQSGKKIPYTDSGIASILAIVLACLDDGVNPAISGGLSPTPAPTATAPKALAVSPLDRGNRLLPGIQFGGQLSGSINKLKLNGQIAI